MQDFISFLPNYPSNLLHIDKCKDCWIYNTRTRKKLVTIKLDETENEKDRSCVVNFRFLSPNAFLAENDEKKLIFCDIFKRLVSQNSTALSRLYGDHFDHVFVSSIENSAEFFFFTNGDFLVASKNSILNGTKAEGADSQLLIDGSIVSISSGKENGLFEIKEAKFKIS